MCTWSDVTVRPCKPHIRVASHRVMVPGHGFCKPEVSQMHVHVYVKKNVSRLDITVNDHRHTIIVKVLYTLS
ncbi:hypothetical protein Hanom_Chr04g00348241 [Helianthus anomalus]